MELNMQPATPSRRIGVYATGWIVASLLMLAAAGWGAMDWAAALGKGTAGTLQIDECGMKSGSRGTKNRVCAGTFRSATGVIDSHAEVPSQSKVGDRVTVTRTLIGEYIQQDGRSAAGAAARTLIFSAVGIGCGTAGGVYVRRLIR
ncbi:hypothetical protein ABZV61_22525 [Streptomyces sp900116325]|uniref:Uncharacterized protein n=1 Tax=Streptomyces sp. 900116325 TaxID=3154295 RepID=A0ABV2UCD7_9ACTN